MGCRCPIMTQFLVAIGAVTAADMHARDADTEWSNPEWRRHIREENEKVFPHLRRLETVGRVAPGTIARLEEEHRWFELSLDLFGRIVNQEALEAHAATEDALVAMHIETFGIPDAA